LTAPRLDRRRPIVLIAALAAVYFVAAKLGLSLAVEAEQVSAVWPPTGIAVAAVLLFGFRAWPGVALGAFLANVTANESVAVALGITAGNTLEALAGAWLVQRLAQPGPIVDRLRGVLSLAVAATLSTTVAATIGVASLTTGGIQPWSSFPSLWRIWWLGDMMGALVVAPFLLAWLDRPRAAWSPRRLVEACLLLITLALACHFIFSSPPESHSVLHPLAYLIFPFIVWAGWRFDQRLTTTAILVETSIAVWGTVHGDGPFVAGDVTASLRLLHLFMAVVAVTGLLLGAAIAERNLADARRAAEYEIGRSLSEADTSDDAMPRILRVVCDTLRWDFGAFWVPDGGDARLRCVELWHDPALPLAEFAAESRRRGFESSVGLPGRVWAEGRPAWVPDVTGDGNFPRAPVAARAGIRGAFGFPIVAGGNVIAVMEFFSREIRQPDDRLLQLFALIGGQIGLFIQRHRAEEERKRADRALREADARKDEFIATLAHELRNPLAPIRNSLELIRLSTPAREPAVDRALAVMDRQLRQMVLLIDDLLDLSRITQGKIELRRERVELQTVIQSALETSQPFIEEAGHQLIMSLPSEPVYLDADPVRLAQVVSNLLHNACKYTARGGHVWLTIETAGDEALVRVRDDGVGIPPEMLRRVFEMFTQVDRSLERSRGGLGIGLTLVLGLVEMHGGTVSAESGGPDQGSEFVVRLPLAPEGRAPEPPRTAAVAPNRPANARRRILVADDNKDSAESLAAVLSILGNEVRISYDGFDAVTAAATVQPDLVFLDIGMPRLNGYDAASRIREQARGREIRLIALTGWGQDRDRRRSLEVGFDAHLVKPVTPAVLTDILARTGPARTDPNESGS
jgi:signal transduction histidine kinase/integral membrane sensor domain MASE1/ActR/RegA family two-component response regulator